MFICLSKHISFVLHTVQTFYLQFSLALDLIYSHYFFFNNNNHKLSVSGCRIAVSKVKHPQLPKKNFMYAKSTVRLNASENVKKILLWIFRFLFWNHNQIYYLKHEFHSHLTFLPVKIKFSRKFRCYPEAKIQLSIANAHSKCHFIYSINQCKIW